ncbi:MAG: hypothetical protein U5L95_02025 [Candidatus Saccharibacteria bacterium]|nr:hypothetical protein [Candidatus Saccharibacteria bacterium]
MIMEIQKQKTPEQEDLLGSENFEMSPDVAGLEQVTDSIDQSLALESIESSENQPNSGFFKNRWEQIKSAGNKAKDFMRSAKENHWDLTIDTGFIASEENVYTLSFSENLKTRVSRLKHIPRLLEGDQDAREAMHKRHNNPVAREHANPGGDRKFSRLDMAKMAAYELVTLAPVRGMGMLAIEAAAKPFMQQSETARKAHERAKAWGEAWTHETDIIDEKTGEKTTGVVSLHSKTARNRVLGKDTTRQQARDYIQGKNQKPASIFHEDTSKAA